MAKNYVKSGDLLTFTAGADLTGGQFLKVGDMPGVVVNAVANGESGELATCGIFTLPKATADTPDNGDKAYWDAAEAEATTDDASGANDLIGIFAGGAGNGDVLAAVRLSGVPV